MSKIIIETERLRLRTWKEEDAEPYYQMNQDPRVMDPKHPLSKHVLYRIKKGDRD